MAQSNVREEIVRLIVDGDQVEGSYNEIQKAQRQIVKNLKGMERGTEEYNKESKKLARVNKQLDSVKKDIREVGKEWKKQKSVWSDAKSVFTGAFAALSVQGAIGQIQQLGRQVVNFIKVLTKQRREITRLTGLTGEALDTTSAKIQSIVDTYDQGFEDVLQSANTVAKAFEINLPEALEKMQTGFNNGADSSGEFLAILKEYPTQLKAAGLSADQSIALIQNQVQSGIFSDKGIDSIKEATIRLRELTPATRDALDAIGISSDELEHKLRTNTISYFDAIQMVSEKLDSLEAQSPEVGTAIADIFGGPGEDAGLAYLQTLHKVDDQLVEVESTSSKLMKANERLAQSFQMMSDDEGALTKLEIGFIKLKTSVLEVMEVFNRRGFIQGMRSIIDPAARQANLAIAKAQAALRNAPMGPEPPSLPGLPDPFGGANPNQTPGSTSARSGAMNIPGTPIGRAFDDYDFAGLSEALREGSPFDDLIDVEGITSDLDKIDQAFVEANDKMVDSIKGTKDAQQELQLQTAQMFGNMIASSIEFGDSFSDTMRQAVSAAISSFIANAILGSSIPPSPASLFLAPIAGKAAQKLVQRLIPSFFFGGPTGNKSIGFGDQYGPFTGFTHPNEYVIPQAQRFDPYVANTESYLEGRRRFGSAGAMHSPGQQKLNVSSNVNLEGGDTMVQAAEMFMDTVMQLQKKGIKAKFTRREGEYYQEDLDIKNSNQGKATLYE